MASIDGDLSDGVGLAELHSEVHRHRPSLSDGIQLERAEGTPPAPNFPPPLIPFAEAEVRSPVEGVASDIITMTSTMDAIHAKAATVVDVVGIAAAQHVPSLGELMRENVALAPLAEPQTTYHIALAEVTDIRARLIAGFSVPLSDVMQLAEVLSDQMGLRLRETVGIDPLILGVGRYGKHHQESVRLSELLHHGLGGSIAETIGLAGTLQGVALFDQLLADTVEVDDTITSAPLLLQVVADETVGITASDALRMFYAGQLSDAVQITAIYPSISGSVTTWALNTKTGSLTEYADYAFNSFARLDGRYLGAADDGLYELTGDTDDGDDIIAEIETGLAQISGSRFTSFRAAYLAVRGGGQFVLRLETGDGKVYNYAVTADHMETTKVQLGKGLRARYFSFTLISAGQDFDLEALEFIPIAARRRV